MNRMGIWIDHRSARVFRVSDGRTPRAEEVQRIESDAEEVRKSATGHMGNMPAHGVGGAGDAMQRRTERRRDQSLAEFYKRISDAVAEADMIVIIGPGPARDELGAAMEADRRFEGRVRRVHSADTHLTDAQVSAKIAELATKPA